MTLKDLAATPMWKLLAVFEPYNFNGGVLHIVLEDQNIEDENIQFCLKEAREKRDLLGIEIAVRMLGYTPGQRAACLLIWDALAMLDVPSAHDYSWE